MNQPLWKKIISYFFELHIESASSEFNPHLYVSLKQGRYQLCTANAVYSFEELYDNFSGTFQVMNLDRLNFRKVLILGLGLGSIPVILERTFHKNYHYTAVEIDEAVIYLANKYITSNLESGIEMICTDAFAFVAQCEEQFDLICMDIFLDDTIPEQFESIPFLENLKKCLNPDGALLYNRLAVTREDRKKSKAFLDNPFRVVFPNATYLDLSTNWMLINKVGFIS